MSSDNFCRPCPEVRCWHQQAGLRLIHIVGVDVNPCGGTHLASLSELQARKRPSPSVHQDYRHGYRPLSSVHDDLGSLPCAAFPVYGSRPGHQRRCLAAKQPPRSEVLKPATIAPPRSSVRIDHYIRDFLVVHVRRHQLVSDRPPSHHALASSLTRAVRDPQLLKVVRQEQHRGRAVLRFLCGGRAARALGAGLRHQERLTKVRARHWRLKAALCLDDCSAEARLLSVRRPQPRPTVKSWEHGGAKLCFEAAMQSSVLVAYSCAGAELWAAAACCRRRCAASGENVDGEGQQGPQARGGRSAGGSCRTRPASHTWAVLLPRMEAATLYALLKS